MALLDDKLSELEEFLRECQVYGWANRIDELLHSKLSLPHRATKVRSWFGGMGNLDDVIICRENGDAIADRDYERVNGKFRHFLAEIRVLAEMVRQEFGG
ncbi:MAG: hypothetical protein DCC68_14300 [Planctomycetota bacterium]|nr:MAG: hypothetical protein DCC68_14300 [Planctomycetota bacterium]